MLQPALPTALPEGGVYNSPQLQLLFFQVLTQLQHDKQLAKSQNIMVKSQLNCEDRCRKEQLRRMSYEHEMNEQVEASLVRTQTALETAAEVQRLLEKSKKEAAAAMEEAHSFKELSAKLQQELELESKKSSSLQDLLVRNVTSSLSSLTAVAADFQVVCHKEKQALQEKLEDKERKFGVEKQALQEKLEEKERKFEVEKQALQEKLEEKERKFEVEKQALQENLEEKERKFQEEKRRCDGRNSPTAQNIMNLLQQLNDATNANHQISEHVKETLLDDLQSLRTSLESNLLDLAEQLEGLQKDNLNITNNLDKYLIRPKENVKLLSRVLKGRTKKEALKSAAALGNVTELEILLDSGANIESVDDKHIGTALKWAAANGHVEACRFLIERGADLERGVANYTALHSAAYNNRLKVVKLLVEMGANVTATNSDGKTPAGLGNQGTKDWFKNTLGL